MSGNDVQRWDCNTDSYGAVRSCGGDWVKWDDHDDIIAEKDAEIARLRESVESGAWLHAAVIEQLAEVMSERDGLREQLSRTALDALAADTQAFEAYEKQIVAEAELARVMALEQNERTPHMDEAARLRKGLERIRDSTFRSAAMLRAAADAILNGGTPMNEEVMLRCYQCDAEVMWLAPDSRCSCCTRCTPEEVQ